MNEATDKTETPQPAPAAASAGKIHILSKPGFLLLTMVATILTAETLIMLILPLLPPLGRYGEAALDAVSLSCLMFPSLYFFVFKPLTRNIAQRRQAEAEKDALIADLHTALREVKTLRGIVPICASCKKIRNDQGFWQQVEVYVSAHTDALFSHGLCPECAGKLYPSLAALQGRAPEGTQSGDGDHSRE